MALERYRLRPITLAVVAACLLAFQRTAEADTGHCRDPVGRDFAPAPPGELGLSAGRLVELNDALDNEQYDIRALLIVRDCRLAFERYKHGVTREHNHTVYSVTKSVTATLAGVLLHQGKLRSLETPVADLVPRPDNLPPAHWQKTQRITLKDVLQMSSGLAYRHRASGHPIYALDVDRFAVALSMRHTLPPGTRFNYSDGDASIAGAAVAGAARESLHRFATALLFDPLQMANHEWLYTDAAGRQPGGWGLRLRPMDMAKLGQLYLQRGEWNGRRIFNAEFAEQAWAPGTNPTYGLYWWIGRAPQANGTPYFYAFGFKGQWVFVFPTLGLVAAVSASLPAPEVKAVEALIIPALVTAVTANSPPPAQAAAAALAQRQTKGFVGKTRVEQHEQDRPRL